MKRVALAIEKGGTGKTTSAVHLAHALALMGRNVLLVDTDTQDQCAAHLGLKQFQPGLAELILGEVTPRQAVLKARDRLYLLPAGEKLDQVKAGLDDIAARASLETREILAQALSFTSSGSLDWIILDTAPGSDALLLNVLLFADVVITPVPPEMLAIRGMMRFFRTLRLLGRSVDYILPTIHDKRVSKTQRIMDKLKERFSDILLNKISYTSMISEAAGAGLTIFEYKPGHGAAQEYIHLAETIDKESRSWRTNAA
ncbi:MAG: ParA family protein [Desulfovibrio sp.]|nr:MAG: ParA family protein [Desulfovibrio sp.]